MKLKNALLQAATAVALTAAGAAQADDGIRWNEGIGFYVGIDGQAQLGSGTYSGLANPNAGRLTLLFDHGDHFHGIGTYSYTGPVDAASVLPTNANNRIPELYARTGADDSALHLLAGTGAFAGRLVSTASGADVNHAYGHLGVADIQSLSKLGAAAEVLYGSSNGRWKATASNVVVGLKLESITPGLQIAAGGELDIFATTNTYALGDLGSLTFLPTFHVDAGAAPGLYSASFSLVNLGSNTGVGDSGVFHIDFAVSPVPEPGQWALLIAGLAVAALRQKRQG